MAQEAGQADTIEITPAMIEAGLSFYVEWDSEFFEGNPSPSYLVEEIFRRMLSAVSVGSKSTAEVLTMSDAKETLAFATFNPS